MVLWYTEGCQGQISDGFIQIPRQLCFSGMLLTICMWSPKRLNNNLAYTLTIFQGLHFIFLRFRNTKRLRLVQYILPAFLHIQWLNRQRYHIASFRSSFYKRTFPAGHQDGSGVSHGYLSETTALPEIPGWWWEQLGKIKRKSSPFDVRNVRTPFSLNRVAGILIRWSCDNHVAQRRPGCRAQVFSFGVVLLELLTVRCYGITCYTWQNWIWYPSSSICAMIPVI